MGKLQEFLLNDVNTGPVTLEVRVSPFPYPFVIGSITEKENKEIRKGCRITTFDKRTRQKQTDVDVDMYNNRLILSCCIEPNFKDADLQAKYGVRGAEALLDVLLNPGQYTDLLLAVQEINGFDDDVNDLVEEAKNSLPAKGTTPEQTEKPPMRTSPSKG